MLQRASPAGVIWASTGSDAGQCGKSSVINNHTKSHLDYHTLVSNFRALYKQAVLDRKQDATTFSMSRCRNLRAILESSIYPLGRRTEFCSVWAELLRAIGVCLYYCGGLLKHKTKYQSQFPVQERRSTRQNYFCRCHRLTRRLRWS